ncbi:hypothetical protein HYV80_04015 [Candidatus Woesearchaeota archaeon]|nr:hypothetical protein [Candidatus Woesearchaeota archaeon]
MKSVSNASPLIFLAKIEKLDLLSNYEIIIPNQVYEEISKGEEAGKEDAQKIKTLIKKGIIKTEEVEINKELEKQNLGEGEKAAISLAINKKISIVLLDERKARRIAKFYNLNPKGTLGILVDACNNSQITKKELKESIKRLVEEGYRINEGLILKLLNGIEQHK